MGQGVRREVVFAALRAKGIDFAPVPDSKHLVEVVGPDGEMSTEYIPPELGRREPQRLSDLYGIPIQWLYNELMIPSDDDGKPAN
jgi:hypothetical protein